VARQTKVLNILQQILQIFIGNMNSAKQENETRLSHYAIAKEPYKWPPLILATMVHAVLFSFLWLGAQKDSDGPVETNIDSRTVQNRQASLPPKVVADQPQQLQTASLAPAVLKRKAIAILAPQQRLPPPISHPKLPSRKIEQPRKEEKPLNNNHRVGQIKRPEPEIHAGRLQQMNVHFQKKLSPLREARQAKVIAKKDALAVKKDNANVLAKKNAEIQAQKFAAEQKRQQDLAQEKLANQSREDEMRRITAGSIAAGSNRNQGKTRQPLSGSGQS
jgi:hypothetical protein